MDASLTEEMAMLPVIMTIKVSAVLLGWNPESWADDGPCGGLPAGSISRVECERNARRQETMPQDRGVKPPQAQHPRSSMPSGTPSPPFYGNPHGSQGEALCGRWQGGSAEEAERFLACRKAAEEGTHPVQIQQMQELDKRVLEERRVRALEEAAQAQREQAEAQRRQAEAQRRQADNIQSPLLRSRLIRDAAGSI